MSQTFTDGNLLTWEAFATGGRYGLSVRPRVVFHCLSDRSLRPRVVVLPGAGVGAQELVEDADPTRLRELFAAATELS